MTGGQNRCGGRHWLGSFGVEIDLNGRSVAARMAGEGRKRQFVSLPVTAATRLLRTVNRVVSMSGEADLGQSRATSISRC
jgi:hypothetical protein